MKLDGRTRVITPHDPKLDYHDWWMPGETVYRDALGRRPQPGLHGGHRWGRVECNNTECPALALVKLNEIEQTVASWLPKLPTWRRARKRR